MKKIILSGIILIFLNACSSDEAEFVDNNTYNCKGVLVTEVYQYHYEVKSNITGKMISVHNAAELTITGTYTNPIIKYRSNNQIATPVKITTLISKTIGNDVVSYDCQFTKPYMTKTTEMAALGSDYRSPILQTWTETFESFIQK